MPQSVLAKRAMSGSSHWTCPAPWQERKWKLTLSAIAVSACEKGKKSQFALDLLITMGRAAVEASTTSYNVAVSACGKGNEWQLALGLLSTMERAKVEADTISYSAAISACEKGNNGSSHWHCSSQWNAPKWKLTSLAIAPQSVVAKRQGGAARIGIAQHNGSSASKSRHRQL